MFTHTSFALDNSERLFVWNEANAVAQQAKSRNDYMEAAKIYQRLIDDGVRNGTLFYDLGTVLLQADRNAQALDALERAERYLGCEKDVEHNLKIALAKKANSKTVELPWYRLVLFWHFYLSCPQRSAVAAGAFLLFWLALSARRLGLKAVTGAAAMSALVIFIVFASSVAASWQAESAERRYDLNIPAAIAPTNMPAKSGSDLNIKD